MKLSLKAIATNRVKGSVTAFKTYEVLSDGILSGVTTSGYWFINDNGEKQFAHKDTVRDGLSDPKKKYSFDLCLQVKTLEETIKSQIDKSIRYSLKPGGDLYGALRGGFQGGGYVRDFAFSNVSNAASSSAKAIQSLCGIIGDGTIKVKIGDLRSNHEKERDAAVAELDKHLPAYRRSDRGFRLIDNIKWLGELNDDHRKDCMKYEAIIENLMDAFDINTHDELAKFASNLKRSANIIDAARKK